MDLSPVLGVRATAMDTTQQPNSDPNETGKLTRPRPRWQRIAAIVAAVIVVLAICAGGAIAIVANNFASSDIMARNVSIQGVPVAGLTQAETLAKLQADWEPTLPDEIAL